MNLVNFDNARKRKNRFHKVCVGATSGLLTAGIGAMTALQAFATDWNDDVTLNDTSTVDADNLMGKIIGILLTLTRFVGIALVVYGVYEVVMSFMQNQPEMKTKGIIMALAGVVMIVLKTILGPNGIGIIN